MNRSEILHAAVKRWGAYKQADICIEEMSELTKALLKVRREADQETFVKCKENILEEIADVHITIDQMRLIYGSTTEQENFKLERLRKRLEGEGK